MIATFINAGAVLIGAVIGCLIKGGIRERFSKTITQGIALAVILIGLLSAIKAEDAMVLIICLVLGALIGEALKIEQRLEGLGVRLQRRFSKGEDNRFAEGFVSASLLFCVGAMAIVGSLEAGLTGDYATLFAKSLLDGVSAIIFASTLGIGVAFSAAAILLYQGAITLGASLLAPILSAPMVTAMSAVGGLLIVGIGLNMLGVTRIRVGNLLPAIFLSMAILPIVEWIATLF